MMRVVVRINGLKQRKSGSELPHFWLKLRETPLLLLLLLNADSKKCGTCHLVQRLHENPEQAAEEMISRSLVRCCYCDCLLRTMDHVFVTGPQSQ